MRTGSCAGVRVDGRGPHREVGAGSDERIATRREKTSSAYDGRISKTRKRDFVALHLRGNTMPFTLTGPDLSRLCQRNLFDIEATGVVGQRTAEKLGINWPTFTA